MEIIKWFERKFHFDVDQNIFPSILERLEGTPLRLFNKTTNLTEVQSIDQLNGAWSIKEQIGHLTDLEGLWQGRLEDILNGEEYLRSWDLENSQTSNANHNAKGMSELLVDFEGVRKVTMQRLRALEERELYKTALHPRLHQPMRLMDLFLFVAEHDDHHLAVIHTLKDQVKD